MEVLATTTLLDLVEGLRDCTTNDEEFVTTVTSLINSGKVRLVGTFVGASIDVSPAACTAPLSSTLSSRGTEGSFPSGVALSWAFSASSSVKRQCRRGEKSTGSPYGAIQGLLQQTPRGRGPSGTAIIHGSSASYCSKKYNEGRKEEQVASLYGQEERP
jgi:hypothetical protein